MSSIDSCEFPPKMSGGSGGKACEEMSREIGEALYREGLSWYKGEGVRTNLNKAAQCYSRACTYGVTDAMVNLAAMYKRGEGVIQDYKVARDLYVKAVDLGDSYAMYGLALMFLKGQGGEVDDGKAKVLLEYASQRGNGAAMNALANMYLMGQGVEVDYEMAEALYRRAILLGESGAEQNLQVLEAKREEEEARLAEKELKVSYKDLEGKVEEQSEMTSVTEESEPSVLIQETERSLLEDIDDVSVLFEGNSIEFAMDTSAALDTSVMEIVKGISVDLSRTKDESESEQMEVLDENEKEEGSLEGSLQDIVSGLEADLSDSMIEEHPLNDLEDIDEDTTAEDEALRDSMEHIINHMMKDLEEDVEEDVGVEGYQDLDAKMEALLALAKTQLDDGEEESSLSQLVESIEEGELETPLETSIFNTLKLYEQRGSVDIEGAGELVDREGIQDHSRDYTVPIDCKSADVRVQRLYEAYLTCKRRENENRREKVQDMLKTRPKPLQENQSHAIGGYGSAFHFMRSMRAKP